MKMTGKPFKIHGRWLKPLPMPKRRWAGYGRRRMVHREATWASRFRFPWLRHGNEGCWHGLWACRLLYRTSGDGVAE